MSGTRCTSFWRGWFAFLGLRRSPRAVLPGLNSSPPLFVFRNRVFGEDPQRPGSFKPQTQMSNYVNDMWPGSPQEPQSTPGRCSRLSSATRSCSSRSSRSRSSVSSRWSSRSRSRPRCRNRSRSRSRSGRRHQRKYRRYSRSYSRSRSRSRSRRGYWERRYGSSRRYYGSPSPRRSRSRSRSRGRSYYRRAYAITRGRRYYGFGRTVYPEEPRSWRPRSKTRSRSPTPFRLSEKGKSIRVERRAINFSFGIFLYVWHRQYE